MAIFDLKANIDLKQNLNIYTTCKQLDSLNLILSVFDNSVQTNLTNYNVRLKAMKADKVPLVQEHTGISISGNVITIETDEQFTTTSGKTLIELQFIDEVTGKKKATFNLVLIVVSTTLEVERGISKATYTLLEELENKLDQASDFFENIEDAIVANNNLKKTISNSETAESNLETAITNANNKKNEVDEAITIATNKIEEVEQSIINANNSKTELDASKTIADTTKIDLDNANVQAEKNIEELNKLGDATDLAAKVQTNTENISKNNKSIEEVNSHLNENANAIEILNKKDLRTAIHYTDGTLFSTSLNNTHDCWNKWVSVEGNNLENAPHTGVIWGEVFTGGDPARAFQIVISVFESTRKTYIRYLHDSKWSSFQYISTGELKTLTLLNGWTALDKDPTVTKSGNAVILNMRIRNGLFTEGSKIAETGYPVKGGNSIFNIFSMYDGSFNGSVYVDGNGSLICGSNIKSNNDTSINISWVTI